VPTQVFEGGDGLAMGRGVINLAGLNFERFSIGFFEMFGAVTEFVNPTSLMLGVGVDQVDGVDKSAGTVGNDEFEVLALEPALEEVVQEPLAGVIGFAVGGPEGDQFLFSEERDAVSDEHEDFPGFE